MIKHTFVSAAVVAAMATTAAAQAAPAAAPDSGEAQFRAIYKELVETNTTVSTGSCTLAAERMAAHLKAAGYADSQITLFSVPDHPKDGGLVAVLPGTSKAAKPILLLAHLDVVEAKRADWERDPFTLIEEGGYFYGRGTADDKSMAAIWVDTMVRLKAAKPLKRTVKLALTCGEETTWAFNGAQWLAQNKRDLIDAEFALNEGGGGKTGGKGLSEGGRLVNQSIQVGEKAVQNYRFETRNPGGHSSIPVRENAIYELADALARLRDFDFPAELSDTTRAFFAKAGAARGDAMGKAMQALAANPIGSPAFVDAEKLVNTDRSFHSKLRTTCVATLLDGGHANNALPQRAGANVNCRIFPGHSVEEIQAALQKVVADPGVSVSLVPPQRPLAKAPTLDPKIIGPMEKLAAQYFPGVPVVPDMSTGATDGIFLEAVGIPTYGVPGAWGNPDGNGVHGLNERIEVKSLLTGRAYLYDLVNAYAR
ncbi:acetylornithine deacetylase/succinyl-diaminopimelate desuccinylase-like protein [Novosphingobium sp. SG916]|nr:MULTISPECIES: M20/M25/M40 family metallo-hydrolase [unclassified Novosphingobium]NMN07292.1 acetylornithine deacetylase/succinyl-diaminopimelate desuccinylase-like protein [Novosphingobium sp. SG919]NMN89600.1 acetylornithine deacetylase/succinyl-diaminopimelate desuccinylase-like protein [Novosphingobium sp. SG916]